MRTKCLFPLHGLSYVYNEDNWISCRDHFRHKTEIAARLTLSGLAVAYYKEVDYQGPMPAVYNIDTDKHNIAVIYDQPIEVRNSSGFEVSFLLI